MIPLKDSVPSQRFPLVNTVLIAVNVLVFLYQQMLPAAEIQRFYLIYGFVPVKATEIFFDLFGAKAETQTAVEALFPLLSANFLHGGWLHLIGNMVYLWIFGDNIESRLGHLRYLLTYLMMGAVSQLFHLAANPVSSIPLVGASGAIAGVLGAYFILFPRSRILTLVPLGFFITFVHLPAVIFLAFWFILQLLHATMAAGVQPVAWWAHVGGFIVGLAVGISALKKRARRA
jgi:membrane associated rhomboid family serine protease